MPSSSRQGGHVTDDYQRDQQRKAQAWWIGLSPRERKRRLRNYDGERIAVSVIAWQQYQRRER